MIDFVTNNEDSSNGDSDEEEDTMILPPTEKAEADWDNDISDDENEGLADHMPRRFFTAPCSTSTLSNKILLKVIKIVMMNHTRSQNKKRQKQNKKERKWKKSDIDSVHDIADPNESPADLSHSIKTPFDAF